MSTTTDQTSENPTMQAAVYHKYGPPEVVKVTSYPRPVPKPDEILIRVHASTVNRTDSGFRGANYFIIRFFSGLFGPRQKVLGTEYAGVVVGLGEKVNDFKAGDRVFGFSDPQFGAHAQYMVVKASGPVAHMPEGYSFEEAAPLTEGCHYALCNLRAAKIKAGDQYLINGATGAIGSAAVQLAKYFGAEVTATANTKNMELVKNLGADAVIDHTREDFTKIDRKFDVVFDAVGKSSFGKCKPLIKPKGIYMSTELGKGSQNPFLALITPLFGGRKVLFPIPSIKKEDVVFIKKLAEEGQFRPVTDRIVDLDEIVEAYRYVETAQKTGNVVIRIT